MGINLIKKIILTTAGITLLLLLSGCPFEESQPKFDYDFKLLFNVFPTKDTLTVGDTIWLKTEFDDTLEDVGSNTIISFTNGDFLIPFIPCIIKKGNQTPPDFNYALNNFIYFSKSGGHMLFDEITVRVKPEYKNHTYKSTLGIIAKQSGLYFIDVSNGEGDGNVYGRIKKATTTQNFNVPDIKDYLLGANYPVLRNDYVLAKMKEYGKCFYFFYVKEK